MTTHNYKENEAKVFVFFGISLARLLCHFPLVPAFVLCVCVCQLSGDKNCPKLNAMFYLLS